VRGEENCTFVKWVKEKAINPVWVKAYGEL